MSILTVIVHVGRVNLIGEHIDHQGFSVLPVALNHTIQVAVGIDTNEEKTDEPNKPLITLNHVHTDKYADATFNSLSDVKVSETPRWVNYIVASLIGVIEFKTAPSIVGKSVARFSSVEGAVLRTAESLLPTAGIQLLVSGDIPVVGDMRQLNRTLTSVYQHS